MDAAVPIQTHVVRANALEYEGTWRLGPDALELTGGPTARADATIDFPYRNISELRLSFAPTRVDSARYRCDVRMRSGQRTAILSTHYAGFADFENRATSYVPLVRELIARVAAANPACKFRSGKRPILYWAEHIFLFAMFALLIFVLSITGVAYLSESSWAKFGIVIAYMPVAILYSRKNWPRSFKPGAIPQDVLPDVPA